MGDKSKIEWTDMTWNPIRARNRETGRVGHFCIHVSDGCKNCYAEGMQRRFGNPVRYAAQDVDRVELFLDEKTLMEPLRKKRPRRIFVCSMTDLFYEGVPDEWIDRIMAVTALAREHQFQVLTKRAERMHSYFRAGPSVLRDRWFAVGLAFVRDDLSGEWLDNCVIPLPNVWLMVSAEDQKNADERIPYLLSTPAAVRGVSLEPLLGPINLREIWARMSSGGMAMWDSLSNVPQLDWVIGGGESGPNARPMHPEWARSLRDQCKAAGVAFHFKQWGSWAPWSIKSTIEANKRGTYMLPDGSSPLGDDMRALARMPADEITAALRLPGVTYMAYLGKGAAGRMLDGRTHDAMPA